MQPNIAPILGYILVLQFMLGVVIGVTVGVLIGFYTGYYGGGVRLILTPVLWGFDSGCVLSLQCGARCVHPPLVAIHERLRVVGVAD